MSFYSHSYKMLSCRISWINCLQPIVLPSLILKPANVMHLWIEEDLIYTGMSGLVVHVAVAKASLAGGDPNGHQPSML